MKKVLLASFVFLLSSGAFAQDYDFLGIFEENEYITERLVYVGDTTFSNWNGWTAVPLEGFETPYAGDTCLALIAGDTWLGWGVTSQDNLDFGDFFENGHMHLALKMPETSTDTFRIGFKTQSDPSHEFAVFFYGPGLDPYNFQRNGEWHELKIPFTDFVQRSGWLPGTDYTVSRSDFERMRNPFLMGGQPLLTLSIDEIWWGKTMADPGATSIVQNGSESFSIYPNPAERYIYLRGSEDGFDNLRVYDMTGKMVKSAERRHINMLEISDLSNGIYLIEAGKNGQTFTSKFIKK